MVFKLGVHEVVPRLMYVCMNSVKEVRFQRLSLFSYIFPELICPGRRFTQEFTEALLPLDKK